MLEGCNDPGQLIEVAPTAAEMILLTCSLRGFESIADLFPA